MAGLEKISFARPAAIMLRQSGNFVFHWSWERRNPVSYTHLDVYKRQEELGAAYSVYAYPSMYYQAGALVIYAGISAEKTELVKQAILREVRGLRENGISEEELEHTKTQITASYIMGQESTSAKMNQLGRNALLLERIIPEEEILANVQNVTLKDMQRLTERVLQEEAMCTGWVLPQE